MADQGLIVKTVSTGKGVFADREFRERELIVHFEGKLFTLEQLPKPYDSVDDHYVQIGDNLYMGPSGKIDDLLNHSCDPNSGLVVVGQEANLIAIRPILPGEEIAWDYSTTMAEDDWEMDCECNSRICRKRIRDFKYLPKETRERYVSLGIVPKFILERP